MSASHRSNSVPTLSADEIASLCDFATSTEATPIPPKNTAPPRKERYPTLIIQIPKVLSTAAPAVLLPGPLRTVNPPEPTPPRSEDAEVTVSQLILAMRQDLAKGQTPPLPWWQLSSSGSNNRLTPDSMATEPNLLLATAARPQAQLPGKSRQVAPLPSAGTLFQPVVTTQPVQNKPADTGCCLPFKAWFSRRRS